MNDDTYRHCNNNLLNIIIIRPTFSVLSFMALLLFLLCNICNNNVNNVYGFAYTPNFITKMIQEQTSIQPRGLLSIIDTTATTSTTSTSNHNNQMKNDNRNNNENDDDYAPSSSTLTLQKNNKQDVENNDYIINIKTRFPTETNGYLHLGHAKAITFNFEVARVFNGLCHMRLDDTNQSKETIEYVNSILEDVIWIQDVLCDTQKAPWDGPVRKTSNYFQYIYECAIELTK